MPRARGTGLTILAGRSGPGAISNLELWLRSDAGIGLVGNAVASWADQSGHSPARDALQATSGNRPAFTFSDANFNGKPSLNFNGATSNRFMAGALPIGATANQFTIVAVSKMAVASQSGGILDVTSAGGLTNAGQLLLQNAANRSYRYGSGLDLQYAFGSTSVTVHFATTTRVNVNQQQKRLFEKTTLQAGPQSTTVSDGLALTQYRLGRLFQDVFPFNGDIAELMVYTKPLSLAEMTALSGFLSVKYGIA